MAWDRRIAITAPLHFVDTFHFLHDIAIPLMYDVGGRVRALEAMVMEAA